MRFGFRLGPYYVSVKDTRTHRLRYSERKLLLEGAERGYLAAMKEYGPFAQPETSRFGTEPRWW